MVAGRGKWDGRNGGRKSADVVNPVVTPCAKSYPPYLQPSCTHSLSLSPWISATKISGASPRIPTAGQEVIVGKEDFNPFSLPMPPNSPSLLDTVHTFKLNAFSAVPNVVDCNPTKRTKTGPFPLKRNGPVISVPMALQ